MELEGLPSWAEGNPRALAEQYLNITGDCISHSPTIYFALVAATAAASIHNVLTTSPASSRQQQMDNIRATVAAVVQPYRTRRAARGYPEDDSDAGAQRTPAALKRLNKMIEQLQQQQREQQQQEPQLVTAAFEVSLLCVQLLRCLPLRHMGASRLSAVNISSW
jgi:hypothetical protein